MAKVGESDPQYFLDADMVHAREHGHDEGSFAAGWKIGYNTYKSLYGPDTLKRGMGNVDIPVEEMPLIMKPGETVVLPESSPGTRSVGTAAAVKVVQAIKDSGWDLEKLVVCWLGIVASLIVLGFGMKLVFGVELLAQGVAGFWSWFVQP